MVVLKLVFFIVLPYQVVLGSRFVTQSQIQSAVKKCCNPSMEKCCRENLEQDKLILCGINPQSQSIEAAVCLEQSFYNGSIIKTGAHKCCWLMSSESCFNDCRQHLLQPTLPFSEKFNFIDECPSGGPPAQIEKEFTCLYAKHPLRECFSLCRGWTEKRIQKLGLQEQENKEFEPLRDCPVYRQFIQSNACVFNTEK